MSAFGEKETLLAPSLQDTAEFLLTIHITLRSVDDVQPAVECHPQHRIDSLFGCVPKADLSRAQTQHTDSHIGGAEGSRLQRVARGAGCHRVKGGPRWCK